MKKFPFLMHLLKEVTENKKKFHLMKSFHLFFTIIGYIVIVKFFHFNSELLVLKKMGRKSYFSFCIFETMLLKWSYVPVAQLDRAFAS